MLSEDNEKQCILFIIQSEYSTLWIKRFFKLLLEATRMNGKKKLRREVATFLIFTAIAITTAEVRSGFWTEFQGSGDSMQTQVDFSALSPFCNTEGSIAEKCSCNVADCFFRYDSIIAPNGIYFDSSISAELLQFIERQNITRNLHYRFYLDSMMKKNVLQAPLGNYSEAISAQSGAFFIKTIENHYAVMVKVGEYIGGINRIYYYWAYQPDGGTILSKERIFEQPASLTIKVSCFSGRPDPSFTLTDSTAVAAITHAAYTAVNTLLDSTIISGDTGECPSILGYRKLTLTGMFSPAQPGDIPLHTIEVCRGRLCYTTDPLTSMLPPQAFFIDRDARFEKLVIQLCCEQDLTSTDEVGTVRFCDVVPDSLKTTVRRAAEPFSCQPGMPVIPEKAGMKTLRFQVNEAGRMCIDLFDMRGRRLFRLTDRWFARGGYRFDFRGLLNGHGAYLVVCTRPESKSGGIVFTFVIQ